ncbi:MAG TPA: ABC transporter permease [Firmicutes bacterium]|nr:ABC transporter permease [Bacillota bacterium]
MSKQDTAPIKQAASPGAGRLNTLNLMARDGNLLRLFAITILVFVTMSLLRPELFFTPDNFSSMAFQFPEFGLLAIAIMITMLTGGIDLSVVGIANFSGILAALTLTRLMPPDASGTQVLLFSLLAVAVSLVTGIVCGLLNGFLVAYVGITPILATLGTMQLFTGIAIVITQGAAVYGFPDPVTFLGNGSLWIFPVPFLIFAAFAVAFAVVLNKTAYGFNLYLMGTNPTAAHFSGINNTRMLLKTYLLSGLMAAVAGFVVLARTNSAKADYGSSYTLQAILIAVLGGVNPAGGFGTVLGLVLAILTLQFLSSGFNMLRFSNFFKEFIWGAVLLLVMVINYLSNTRLARAQARRESEPEKQAGLTGGVNPSV